MPVLLDSNSYGKSRVRVVKVTRRADRHDLAELTVDVRFEGDFDAVHTEGDNRNVLTTDAMKNTVNALAKTWSGDDIEEFGVQLIEHFLADNPQVARVRIEIAQGSGFGWAATLCARFRGETHDRGRGRARAREDCVGNRESGGAADCRVVVRGL